MGRISKSLLFSDVFSIGQEAFDVAGLLNPYVNHDTRLFIDPLLIAVSKNELIQTRGTHEFRKYFEDIIRLLRNSTERGDVCWRAASQRLSLAEAPEICLGFGGTRGSGKKPDRDTVRQVMATAKEIVDLGISEPELFGLLPLIEDGVGIDTIGDLTATAIKHTLFSISEAFSSTNKLPTEVFHYDGTSYSVCRNPIDRRYAVLFCPLDILRDLPVVRDWSDVADAAERASEVRRDLNAKIGDIWQASTRAEKDKLRTAALSSKDAFESVLRAVGLVDRAAYPYDLDPDGIRTARYFRQKATDDPALLVRSELDKSDLRLVVREILETYRRLIEDNRSYDLIYNDDRSPRKEKAMQKLLYVVAQCFCEANNISLNPETDNGGGPVDFKFSRGTPNIIVEVKRSNGSVEHGFESQIRTYEAANRSFSSILAVVDVGGLGKKLENIQAKRNKLVAAGKPAPEIFYIDATKRPSASKAS